jgi:hypothetical protein
MDEANPIPQTPFQAPEHTEALDAVAEAAGASRAARLRYEWRVYVAHALGASATKIAERAGVSRQRITQMLAEIERDPDHADHIAELRRLQRDWSFIAFHIPGMTEDPPARIEEMVDARLRAPDPAVRDAEIAASRAGVEEAYKEAQRNRKEKK